MAWIAPVAISDKCGEETGHEATLAIDGNIGTYWNHDAAENHNIIFDLGSSKIITKCRLYQTVLGATYWWGGEGANAILFCVSSDAAFESGDLVWEGDLYDSGWVESGEFSREGRYVGFETTDQEGLATWRMYEFQAFEYEPPTPSGVKFGRSGRKSEYLVKK